MSDDVKYDFSSQEPVEPTVPQEPVNPTEPVEPINPVEPTEPVIPVEPVEPTVPQEPVEPTEPTGSQYVEVPEESVLEYLSEKLGRTITSFDDINKTDVNIHPQVKAISDWAERTGRPIEEWTKFNKDYSSMSNMEKAKEILELKYPTLTQEEINLELSRFVETEDDLDHEKAAKSLELKKLVSENERILEENRLKFDQPIEGYGKLSPEIQQEIEFAKSAKEGYEKAKEDQRIYEEMIIQSTSKFEGVDLKLSDDFSIKLNMTPEDKKELPTFLSTMPHWYNPDGSTNHDAIVKDSFIIKNIEKITKLAFEQGKASGIEEATKTQNNITLDNRPSNDSLQPQNEGMIIEGSWKPKGSKVVYGKR